MGEKTLKFIDAQLASLRTADLAGVSWAAFGEAIVVDTLDEAFALADDYASEHVQILTQEPRLTLRRRATTGHSSSARRLASATVTRQAQLIEFDLTTFELLC